MQSDPHRHLDATRGDLSQDSNLAPALAKQAHEFSLAPDAIASENVILAARIRGALPVDCASAILNEVLMRHEVMRTTLEELNGEVVQRVHPDTSAEVRVVDLATDRLRARRTARAVVQDLDRPFRLTVLPLARPTVVRLAAHDTLMTMIVPHSVSDGGCRYAFHHEIARALAAVTSGQPMAAPEVQLRDLAQWERCGDHAVARAYWTAKFRGVPRLAACPLSRGALRRERYLEATTPPFHLGRWVSTRLRGMATRYGLSPAALSLAALASLLCIRSGLDCVVIGLYHHNRFARGSRTLLGSLFDVVPLPLTVPRTVNLIELAQEVQGEISSAEAHRLPWADARAMLKQPIDVALNYYSDFPQPAIEVPTTSGPVTVEEYRPLHIRRAKFPVTGPLWDCRVAFDVRPSRAGVYVSAGGAPSALATTEAAMVSSQLADLLRRLPLRDGEQVAQLATRYE